MLGKHEMTLAAYRARPEIGHGFRAVVYDRVRDVRHASAELFATIEEARYWAKARAHGLMAGRFYQLAPLRMRGEYRANLWTYDRGDQ